MPPERVFTIIRFSQPLNAFMKLPQAPCIIQLTHDMDEDAHLFLFPAFKHVLFLRRWFTPTQGPFNYEHRSKHREAGQTLAPSEQLEKIPALWGYHGWDLLSAFQFDIAIAWNNSKSVRLNWVTSFAWKDSSILSTSHLISEYCNTPISRTPKLVLWPTRRSPTLYSMKWLDIYSHSLNGFSSLVSNVKHSLKFIVIKMDYNCSPELITFMTHLKVPHLETLELLGGWKISLFDPGKGFLLTHSLISATLRLWHGLVTV